MRNSNPPVQTNPRYPTFTQSIYTAGDVDQFNEKRKRISLVPRRIIPDINLFHDEEIKILEGQMRTYEEDRQKIGPPVFTYYMKLPIEIRTELVIQFRELDDKIDEIKKKIDTLREDRHDKIIKWRLWDKSYYHPYFDLRDNTYASDSHFAEYLQDRVLVPNLMRSDVDLYEDLNSTSVWNTFRYIFFKFKKGLFVQIRDNQLITFLPFSNADYHNEFSPFLKVDSVKFKNVQSLINHASKLGNYQPVNALPLDEWIGNNAMFRYEYQKNEGDNNVEILRNLFQSLCNEREVPDIDFFVNRRDYPLLQSGEYEPYFHVFGSYTYPLISHNYTKYSPILSGSTEDSRFSDVLYPHFEDWARACFQNDGTTFPKRFNKYPLIIDQVEWIEKQSIAVFRGSTTGAGTTEITNQRLAALALSEANPDILDVGITKWNMRIRKYVTDKYLSTIERKNYPIAKYMTLQEQSNKYKYILNLEGHVSAYRLAYELSSGSVILLAGSQWTMWYSKFLTAYEHYVPIKGDLSDLIEQIKWCRDNDEKCQQIVRAANNFYEHYLNRKCILDYLQLELIQLSDIAGYYEYLPDLWHLSLKYEKSLLEKREYNNDKYIYNLQQYDRNIGHLDGTMIVFESKTENDFTFVNNVISKKSTIIDLYACNNFFISRKKINDEAKFDDLIHNVFIGTKIVNKLVSKCPNFIYSYGFIKNSKFTATEYIVGPTFEQWLLSSEYTFQDYVHILVQINLALTVAQRYCGFVHYGLYPRNIIIQKLSNETLFDYSFATTGSFRCSTKLIPIIIDFDRSRGVYYDEDYGLIDCGHTNLYKPDALIDTVTVLFSSIKILGNKLTLQQSDLLLSFADKLEIPRYLYKLRRNDELFLYTQQSVYSTADFIGFISGTVGFNGKISTITGPEAINRMSQGNRIITSKFMKYGNYNRALLELILYIGKMTRPTDTGSFGQNLLKRLLYKELYVIDDYVNSKGNDFEKFKWEAVKKILLLPQPRIETNGLVLDLPTSIQLTSLSLETTKDNINELINTGAVKFVPDDWSVIWEMFFEQTLNSKRVDVDFNYTIRNIIGNINLFVILNAIASNNTLLKIRKEIE
jgi:hypothetical protein